ncbi:MAG: hypothetical protein IJ512_06780 [Ruminococcus sp.]|nr:hypothetical protein [Ruminococcus sp.]
MQCINCGRELLPDTAECPFCLEKEKQKAANKTDRHKVYITLSFCILILGLIAAGLLLFLPKSAFQRELEAAESSYTIAALCESYPEDAGDERYQLRLLDAADDIEKRYNDLSSGYNQTATALRQLCGVDNAVVCDRAEEVWANVECMRLYQLINHSRTENGRSELTWEPDTAAAAETVAAEYDVAGMDYQSNAERLIQSMIPDAKEISISTVFEVINAQDALVQGEERAGDFLPLTEERRTQVGIGAARDAESGLWSFFILMQP